MSSLCVFYSLSSGRVFAGNNCTVKYVSCFGNGVWNFPYSQRSCMSSSNHSCTSCGFPQGATKKINNMEKVGFSMVLSHFKENFVTSRYNQLYVFDGTHPILHIRTMSSIISTPKKLLSFLMDSLTLRIRFIFFLVFLRGALLRVCFSL